ncbi:hypothetical protein ASD24_09720 [Paenibacillus sp. Root52]|uniref:hypothetical protein n=1 Tax=Paenibacillus sp. Root52 TaxID=1736552 RepID=UPI00070083D1|nr:hypothetical protein [Paenibacillus sp. Root52]KQY84062.1 hypothetical protein ASD24_09720 [Paenibacillus sp. Root52]
MYAVIANVIIDNQLRTGAKVFILYCHGMAESPKVYGMAKGGKRIEKYISYKKLKKFRSQWIPEHIRPRVHWSYEDRASADRSAKALELMWTNVRVYDTSGKLVKDGVSSSKVDEIAKSMNFMDRRYVFDENEN